MHVSAKIAGRLHAALGRRVWHRSEYAKSLREAVKQGRESIPDFIFADRGRVIARQVTAAVEDAQVAIHNSKLITTRHRASSLRAIFQRASSKLATRYRPGSTDWC